MLNESMLFDSRKQKTRKESQLRYSERESKFLERCSKLERTLIKKENREILSKSILTLDQLSMLQSQEMDFLLIRKPPNMKFSQMRCKHTMGFQICLTQCQKDTSSRFLTSFSLAQNLLERKSSIRPSSRKLRRCSLKRQRRVMTKNKESKSKIREGLSYQ